MELSGFAALITLAALCTGTGGLRQVELHVPAAVTTGSTATLLCHYDLENDPLYVVKWYKGRKEFFRYMPKEKPRTSVFPLAGVNIDQSMSDERKVVLREVTKELTGRYRCEVSTDAPDFHTTIVTAYMNVVDPLKKEPVLMMEKQSYSVGDTLRGNCTTPPSSPAANITWLINGQKVNASYIVQSVVEGQDPVTIAGLNLPVKTYLGGKLTIVCVADLFQVYSSRAETTLDEERPILAPVLGNHHQAQGSASSFLACALLSSTVLALLSFLR
uniref:Ig-like domain-containing protein n=1 Tax=Cuerna arida TaxID=1464854 RepID=A0A1B6EXC4_9HEMI